MKTRFIGILGAKRVGKSTASSMIQFMLDGINTMAFATPLKHMAAAVGYPYHILHGPSELRDSYVHPGLGISARHFLQQCGEGIRKRNPEAFVSYLKADYALAKHHGPVLITDLRHPEEVLGIRGPDAVIIHLTRDNGDTDPHESEVYARSKEAGIDCGYRLTNDGSLLQLAMGIRCVLHAAGLVIVNEITTDEQALKASTQGLDLP